MGETNASILSATGELQQGNGLSILRKLVWSGASATIILQQDRNKLALYLRNGTPAGAKSNLPSQTLVRLAHRFNLISDQQMQQVVTSLNEGSTLMQGELMLQQGLDPQRLDQLLRRQTATRFATMLDWETGRYRVKPELPDEIPGAPCGATDVFFERARERWTPSALIEAAQAQTAQHVALASDLPDHLRGELQAHPAASRWLQRLARGAASLEELAGAPARQTARLWLLADALRSLGVLVAADTSAHTARTARNPGGNAGKRPLPETVQAIAAEDENAAQPVSSSGKARQAAPTATASAGRMDERQSDPELDALYEQMREQDWFQILGIERDVTARDVKKAYFRLAKQYHPDRYFDPETRRPSLSAEKIFALINQAYETLRNDEERQRYLDYLERGTTEEEEMRKAEAILTSEIEFQKAQVLVRLKKYGDAIGHLKTAIELYDEPEYHVYLAWAQFMSGWPDDQAACETAMLTMKDLLERTGKVNTAEGWYLYGRMQKIAGNPGSAKRAFEHVLKLDRHHKDAQRELRVLDS